ncbi:hypothetical protein GQ54DRAFT_305457 [Martensiomyces pterosporus]|nr:hypothetical protein GQ54DRAFT_305457 [Martensiomyces pterosporus]
MARLITRLLAAVQTPTTEGNGAGTSSGGDSGGHVDPRQSRAQLLERAVGRRQDGSSDSTPSEESAVGEAAGDDNARSPLGDNSTVLDVGEPASRTNASLVPPSQSLVFTVFSISRYSIAACLMLDRELMRRFDELQDQEDADAAVDGSGSGSGSEAPPGALVPSADRQQTSTQSN